MCGKIVLSKRMHAVASLVTPGNSVCDVGCDHGFIPIYLVKQGIAPKALAMDVNEGPLRQAKEHIAAFGLESYIETRISDGIASCRPGEADFSSDKIRCISLPPIPAQIRESASPGRQEAIPSATDFP